MSKISPVLRHTSSHVATRARPGLVVAASLALAGGLAGPSPATAAPEARVAELHARLVPSGDPNGSGSARFTLDRSHGRVCATASWHGIATPNAAHIHRKSDGGIVVDLTGVVTGGTHCARGVSHALIGRILAHPGRYYFNVHNGPYPAGAIQGTLHR